MKKLLRVFALLLVAQLVSPFATAATDWSLRLPTPSQAPMKSITWGDDHFVTLDGNNTVWTSPDGLSWTRGTTLPDARKLVSNGTRFAALHTDKIWLSDDGVTWTEHTAPHALYDLAWLGDQFVALGFTIPKEGGTSIFTTTDGSSWAESNFDASFFQIRSTGDRVAAFSGSGRVVVSTDATTWTAADIYTPGTDDLGSIAIAGNGKFLVTRFSESNVAQATYLSADGLTWEIVTEYKTNPNGPTLAVPSVSRDRQLGFAAGYFYARQQPAAYDRGTVYRTADGKTWTEVPDLPASLNLQTLAGGDGVLLASEIVPADFNLQNVALGLYRSTDGLAWNNVTQNPFLGDVGIWPVYGFGRFFAGGFSSPDGVTWDPSPFSPTHAAGDLLFQIATRFTPTSEPLDEISEAGYLVTTVDISADGVNSARVDVGIPSPRSVAYGAGRYVIVGYNGEISTSTDGITWQPATSPTTQDLRAVKFLLDRFIAVGESGTLIHSSDGLSWTAESPDLLGSRHLQDVTTDGTRLLAVSDQLHPSGVITSTTVTLGNGLEAMLIDGQKFQTASTFDGRFMITSTGRGTYYDPADVYESTDGVTWTAFQDYAARSGTARVAVGPTSAIASVPVGKYDPAAYNVVAYVSLWQSPADVPATAPAIVFEPTPQSIARGESTTFMAGATGTGPFTYQWAHNGVAIEGATRSVLNLTDLKDADAGDYTLTVTNAEGSATSAAAALTVVEPTPLTITTQPVGGALENFQEFTLSVEVSGSGPVSYQWRRNGVPLTNATRRTLSIYAPSSNLPNYVGDYDVVVTAPNSTVTSDIATLTSGAPAVTITPGGNQTYNYGDTLHLEAHAEGDAPFTYTWSHTGSGPTLSVNSATLVLPYLTSTDSGPYRVTVTDADGSTSEAYVVINVNNPAGVPAPEVGSAAIQPGQSITLRAPIFPGESATVQWRRDGEPIAGATDRTLNLADFTVADSGRYDAVVTVNGTTSSVRGAIDLSVAGSHLSNLSTRAYSGTGDDTLVLGFVTTGTSTDSEDAFLIRGVGPGLVRFDVNGAMVDPAISVMRQTETDTSPQTVASNDDWTVPVNGALPVTSDLLASRGAFALNPDQADAALAFVPTSAGPFTIVTREKLARPGVVLDEIYAPDTTHVSLINLSARGRVGSGDQTFVVGFAISGQTPLRLMIRGVGPGLTGLGIANAVANPKLVLYDASAHALHNNDTWSEASNAAEIATVAQQVGAFELATDSNDAVILESLPPGIYTAHLTSVDNSVGVGLIELYVVP